VIRVAYDTNIFRVPNELRQEDRTQEMYNYIDHENTKILMNKLKDPDYNYLKEFLEDYYAELDVNFSGSKEKILCYLLYRIGKLFADRIVKVPDNLDRNELAYIFIRAASEQGHPKAQVWVEKHHSHQVSRLSGNNKLSK